MTIDEYLARKQVQSTIVIQNIKKKEPAQIVINNQSH